MLLLCCKFATAQDLSIYERHWYIDRQDSLPYRLLLPENYEATKKYPLIFFLHGAGERGNDNESQLLHGGKLFLKEDIRKNFPAIVVFPQCPQKGFWAKVNFNAEKDGQRFFLFDPTAEATPAMKLAQDLLREIIRKYPVEKSQVYVAGLSMGGMGTFEIVRRNPGLFAAAIPICGGGDPSSAKRTTRTKWWVFHGAKDNVVPSKYSDEMVDALKKAKASVKYTLYPDADHNSWDAAFAEPELLSWLFAQHK
jgi:predicted peptidase